MMDAGLNVGLEGLLQIIGELEVHRRALTDDNTIKHARISELEQEIIAFKNTDSKPTPIVAEAVTSDG